MHVLEHQRGSEGEVNGARDTGALEMRKVGLSVVWVSLSERNPKEGGEEQGACTKFVRANLPLLSADLDLVSGFKVTGSICFLWRTMAKEMVCR